MVEEDVDIDKLFEPENKDALDAYLRLLHPVDLAELFHFVKPHRWVQITHALEPEVLAEVLTHLEESQLEELGEALGTDRLAEALEELESDDAADVLGDLPEEQSEALLARLEDKEELAALLAYPEDTAGGLMQTEVCVVPEGKRVADAIEAVRTVRKWVDDIFQVYVVDADNRLVGTVDLEDLVLTPDDQLLSTIRRPVEVTVDVGLDQEEVAKLFRKYDVAAMPVVDNNGVLLGRITFDDVHDVLEEEASEDILAMAGASSEDLVYSGTVYRVAAFRLPWLVSSLMGSLVTTQLVPLFSNVPGDTIVLAAFVPLVAAMTGNVGSQTAMIITRGFAIGRVDFATLGRSFFREISVGLTLGLAAGTLVSIFAYVTESDPILGLTLGLAMTTSMCIASAIGTAMPAIFKRLGIDPAIAAGPLVTTGCDVLGVSTYLLVAFLVLS